MTPTVIDGALAYAGGLAVDADGCPTAYKPGGGGLDALGNAGHPGNWYGLVTDTGDPGGAPVVQGTSDPAPGYFVSQTALVDRTKKRGDPRRYVDSLVVPYASVARDLLDRVALGDLGACLWRNALAGFVVAEVGPRGKYGEGSIALADALGVTGRGQVRGRGLSSGVAWVVFPGSRAQPAWPRDLAEFQAAALVLLEKWGGAGRLRGLLAG